MLFRPVKCKKIYKMVINQVKALIKDGSLSPGDRLPPERELASMLTVSRASVRQAICALEALGFVDIRHGDGTYVAEDSSNDSVIESFSSLLIQEQLSPDEIMETRLLIEPSASRICSERATADNLTEIEDMLEKNRFARNEKKPLLDMNRDFHLVIAEATGNRGIVRVMHEITQMMKQNMWPRLKGLSYNRQDRIEEHLSQHVEIAEAIAARDGKRAENSMREHLETIEREMHSDLTDGEN